LWVTGTELVETCAVSPWLVVLCWRDCRERRLPNAWTLGGLGLILAWRLVMGGLPGFLSGVAAGFLAGAFLLLPFLLRGAGGGDVKMLAACGAFVGWERLLPLLVYTAFAGLGVAVGMWLFGRLDGRRVAHYGRCLFDWRYDRAAGRTGLPPAESERVRVPFSLAIALGAWGAILLPAIPRV
jgi:prepilin peptidase CpaA